MRIVTGNTENQFRFDHNETCIASVSPTRAVSKLILAPKNTLLDFTGDFAKPEFGSLRFFAVHLNLSFPTL